MEDYSDYPDDLEELKKRLFEADNNVRKLAEIGRDLLEENNNLKCQFDELRTTTDGKIEQAEQTKYELQNKYDQKASLEAWLQEEIQSLRQQLQDSQDNKNDAAEAERAQEAAKFTKQIAELRADLEQYQTNESQLKEKVTELELLIQESVKQPDISNNSFDKNEELCQLLEEKEHLHSEITMLKAQLIERKSEMQVLATEHEKICGRLMARDEELEGIRCQFNSVNNALEEARMEKLDLKCQLDALRMETSHHNKKGNSIFSELEDRRVDAEKKVITLQLQNNSLQEKYALEKQQNQKYKRQISQLLLEASSGRVDEEYVASLESKLANTRQELKTMVEKQQHNQHTTETPATVQTEMDNRADVPADKDYQQYLITLLKQREEEKKVATQELSFKTIQLLDEKSKSSLMESQLKTLESDKQKLHSRNLKLSLRIEELQLKYEPDSVKKSGILTVKRREKISLEDPQDVTITETRRIQDNSISKRSADTSHVSDDTHRQSSVFECGSVPNNGAAVNLLDCLKKRKTVRISEDVEEHEIENLEPDTKEMDSSSVQKGRIIPAVKFVKKDHVNECKSQ